jgi:uncharacterized membrane protein YtjA (UPF0391 family)
MLLVLALVTAALGFGGIAGAAATITRVLFWVFIVLFLVGLVFGAQTEILAEGSPTCKWRSPETSA